MDVIFLRPIHYCQGRYKYYSQIAIIGYNRFRKKKERNDNCAKSRQKLSCHEIEASFCKILLSHNCISRSFKHGCLLKLANLL